MSGKKGGTKKKTKSLVELATELQNIYDQLLFQVHAAMLKKPNGKP